MYSYQTIRKMAKKLIDDAPNISPDVYNFFRQLAMDEPTLKEELDVADRLLNAQLTARMEKK